VHRLFVAIRPPSHVRDILADAMSESGDFRWQQDDQLHLTLRFIGEIERPTAEDLAGALGQIQFPALELMLAGAGRFEQRSGGALWAGVEPKAELAALASKIERVCQSVGLDPERRAFRPHITLARWRGRRDREVREFLERTRGLSSPPFAVAAFSLFESRLSRHGAHYEEVERFSLI
jgi:RNA 2',3'-cyclic 3'-phosphodiesterase